ncbi:S49 family peptidase [Histidinibacterium aquaticum]|uniref:S49 family peptidase n=1 Tax=Histidinibacterium aquaticum TaxID=2613962 RepID=A0A5J5GB21_9RHOB|nr:S49 family peptidase [Histidinibacterium aquaticum]KAA9005305.1 S49 family peptidase [Histidinibacterium aquaticum]
MSRFNPFVPTQPRVSVVRLQGAIGIGARGLDDAGLAQTIEKAFRGKPKAVALQISSPGGSPVQSSLIGARIRRLADEKNVPVYAFVEDVAASGGYWLAAAADEIYVDPSSIVGSIGVISAGFGLHELIGRYGIERRVHTAGGSKSFMDPFRPEKPEDVERLDRILEQIHDAFKSHVTTRRGPKLADDPGLFTGEFWVGQTAVEKGLADGVGHLVPMMKDRYGKKTTFRRFGPRRSLFQRLGAQATGSALAELEDRAAYARFGL